jgi:hypothetical protein
MKRTFLISVIAVLGFAHDASAERINHAGRILGPLPVVTNAVLFNTPEADAIVSAMQVFPTTSAWNEDISHRPVLSNSDAMIAQIIADLRSDRRMLFAFKEMNFALVPDNQSLATMRFVTYPGESVFNGGISPNGLYPIPHNLPVKTWPVEPARKRRRLKVEVGVKFGAEFIVVDGLMENGRSRRHIEFLFLQILRDRAALIGFEPNEPLKLLV